jgi:hypothetical protein
LTFGQFNKIKTGEIQYFAIAGKKLQKSLSAQMKLKLIDMGAHIAHNGGVKPYECWLFNKNNINKLDSKASNFFEFATLVTKETITKIITKL